MRVCASYTIRRQGAGGDRRRAKCAEDSRAEFAKFQEKQAKSLSEWPIQNEQCSRQEESVSTQGTFISRKGGNQSQGIQQLGSNEIRTDLSENNYKGD
jgi:hypothetical protein